METGKRRQRSLTEDAVGQRRILRLLAALISLLGLVLVCLLFRPGSVAPVDPVAPDRSAEKATALSPDEIPLRKSEAEDAPPASRVEVVVGPKFAGRGSGPEEDQLAKAHWIEGRVAFPPLSPKDVWTTIEARGRRFAGGGWYTSDLDANGRFRVAFSEKTRYGRLHLQSNWLHLDRSPRIRVDTYEDEIVLEPFLGGRIEGRVEYPEGATPAIKRIDLAPLEVNLKGEGTTAAGESRKSWIALVNGDGSFSFDALPAGWSYVVEHDSGYHQPIQLSNPTIEPGQITEMVLRPLAAASLAGRVINTAGDVMPDVRVSVAGHMPGMIGLAREDRTATDGTFLVTGCLPGRQRVLIQEDGFLSIDDDLGPVGPGERLDGLTFVLDRGESLGGMVLWPDGKPAPEAKVTIRVAASEDFRPIAVGYGSRAEVDTEGRFLVTGLIPGVYVVEAFAKRQDKDASKESSSTYGARLEGVTHGSQDIVLKLAHSNLLVGRVVDDLGEPVERFTLRAHKVYKPEGSQRWLVSWDPIDSKAEHVRATGGNFAVDGFTNGTWSVHATSPNYGASKAIRIAIPRSGTPLMLVTPRCGELAGRVVDSDGRPVSGACVSTYVEVRRPRTKIRSVKTNADGEFTLGRIPPTTMRIRADAEGFAPSRYKFVRVEAAKRREGVELTLCRASTITGMAYSSDGSAMIGQTVFADAESGMGQVSASTDEKGRFALEGLAPGTWIVSLEAKDAAEPFGQSSWVSKTVRLVEGETEHVMLGLQSDTEVRIEGRVLVDGLPAAGAELRADRGDFDPGTRGECDAQGRFSITLDGPGRWVFRASHRGVQLYETVDIPSQSPYRIELNFVVGSIAGQVLDGDGNPAAGIDISAYSGASTLEDQTGGGASTVSDDHGHYHVSGLPAGKYRVSALFNLTTRDMADPFTRVDVEGVRVNAGETTRDVDINLEDTAALRGVVLDAAGEPVPSAHVRFWTDQGAHLATMSQGGGTDSEGRFHLAGFSEGVLFVLASHDLDVSSPQRVVLKRGGSTHVQLLLQPGTMLVVSGRDQAGSSVPFTVDLRDSRNLAVGETRSRYARFRLGKGAADDTLVFGPLPPGTYEVHGRTENSLEAEGTVEVGNEAEVEIILRFR